MRLLAPLVAVALLATAAGADPVADASVADSSASAPDSLYGSTEEWTSLALQELDTEGSIDAAELAELDDLLADPVSLASGHYERLRLVPGVGDAPIEALRRARRAVRREDLAGLPGWDAELARRVAPFVRFAAPHAGEERRTSAALRTRLREGRRENRFVASVGAWEAAWRDASAIEQPSAGFAHFESRHLEAVAGDLRAAWSQGLLWSPGTRAPRAGNVAAPSPARGLVPSDALSRGRVLRGAGIEARWNGGALLVAGGKHEGGDTRGAALRLAGAEGPGVEAMLLECGAWRGGGLGFRWEGSRQRAGLEVCMAGRHPGASAAAEWRVGPHRLAVRAQGVAPGFDSPLSSLPASASRDGSRAAQIALSTRRRETTGECDLLQESRRGAAGESYEAREAILRLEWRRDRSALRGRWRTRRIELESVQLETPSALVRREVHGLSIAASRLLSPAWRAILEYRRAGALRSESDLPAQEDLEAGVPFSGLPEEGSAWQLRFARVGRFARGDISFATFRTSSAGAGLVLAEPGSGAGGNASWRPKGEGVRLAGACRLRLAYAELGFRFGVAWTGIAAPRGSCEAAAAVHTP